MQRAAALFREHPPGRLQPPDRRGALTVADVVGVGDAVEHCRSVRDWAADVWAAWRAHHALVRSWLEAAA